MNSIRYFSSLGDIALTLTFGLLILAFPAYGQDHSPSATQIQQFEQHVENVRQRLQLTEIQRTDLEPILSKSFEDRINILKSYGFSKETRPKLSLRKKLALRRDMNDLRDRTEQAVSVILNDQQMDEFLEIQEENRKRMR
jgi:hypothetical protein